jgi:hypothetical protein
MPRLLRLRLRLRSAFFFVSFVCFVVPLLVPPVRAAAAEVEFVRVWPGWRDADSFDRIGEYFGGGKNHGDVVLRTHAEAPAGYYFLVRLKNAAAVPDAKFILRVIRPDTPEAKTFTFPAAVPATGAVFQLGLTGADWPKGKLAHPVAWKLELQSADGRVLAAQTSFLWEKPAK